MCHRVMLRICSGNLAAARPTGKSAKTLFAVALCISQKKEQLAPNWNEMKLSVIDRNFQYSELLEKWNRHTYTPILKKHSANTFR